MSFEVYLLLCRLSFYTALLMWDIFFKTFDDISSMMPTLQSTANEHFMFNRIHLWHIMSTLHKTQNTARWAAHYTDATH
jgi:hypothetical protein